jgi:MFS family permease
VRLIGAGFGGVRKWLPTDGLRGNAAFVAVWSAASVSELGSQVSLLALPFVAIVTLNATTFEVAALGLANLGALLLFGLPAGVWLDRIVRRPVMIAADIGRAIAFATVPIAYSAGVLTIWQLYAVGFVSGALTIFFDVGSVSFLPAVVARDELPSANAALQVSAQSAQVAGPGLAGVLIGLLGAPVAVTVDAASYVCSAAFLTRAKATETVSSKESRQPMRREIREGLGYVLGHPLLRPNTTFVAAANLFTALLFAVALLFMVRELDLSARQVGLIFMVSSVGSLLGAGLLPKLQRRFGLGRIMRVTIVTGWALLLIPLASGLAAIPLVIAGLLIWGTGVVIWNASSAAIGQATTPPQMMGRVAATVRLVAYCAMPAGTLLGGIFGTYLGLRTAVFIGAGGRALTGLIVLASPLRSIRTIEDADALVGPYNASLPANDMTLAPAEGS